MHGNICNTRELNWHLTKALESRDEVSLTMQWMSGTLGVHSCERRAFWTL